MSILGNLTSVFCEPNRPKHVGSTLRVDREGGYTIAAVEFDDQGWYYNPEQRDDLFKFLDRHRNDKFVVIAFVHGWKHNADPTDVNLRSFCKLLEEAHRSEQERPPETGARRVLGVYLSWRGLSWRWPILREMTFWGRKEAASRVAVGSMREVIAKLKSFQQNGPHTIEDEPLTRLVLAGHSFGGHILFNAVAEHVIGCATAPDVVRPFGDFVILINPAFEAARYYPLHTITSARQDYSPYQRPTFIAVTAKNDWATGWGFRIGRRIGTLFQSVRNVRQRQTNLNTIGHLRWMRTHTLSCPSARTESQQEHYLNNTRAHQAPRSDEDAALRAFNAENRLLNGQLRRGWSRTYSAGAVLTHTDRSPDNPFWVVEATPEVINGHNGIFGTVFLDFLRQLSDDRLRPINNPPPAPVYKPEIAKILALANTD